MALLNMLRFKKHPSLHEGWSHSKDVAIKTTPSNDLKEAIALAFDEGAESPFELKQQIVNDITKLFEYNPTQKLIHNIDLDQWANYVWNRLPTIVKNILQVHQRIYLCGGSILKHLIASKNGWLKSDYDLFYHKDYHPAVKLYLPGATSTASIYGNLTEKQNIELINKFMVHEAYNHKVYAKYGKFSLNTIQLSKLVTRPSEITDNFDLQMCQIALYWQPSSALNNYEESKPKIIASDNTICDILQRRINLSQKFKETQDPEQSYPMLIKRIKKYIQRGFHDNTRLVEQGILN